MGRVTDQQVRKLNEEMAKHGQVGKASLRAGMDRTTGRKYIQAKALPSALRVARNWSTHLDVFAEDWPGIVAQLERAPELQAKVLFNDLLERRPGFYRENQLRTFQRRVEVWQAQNGPDKEVFFPQEHIPGEALQTDFTWCTELKVTIGGTPFPHMMCHVVLPYSNWGWVTVCQSESMLALRKGVPAALLQLGRVPRFHQTDNCSAATHRLPEGEDVGVGKASAKEGQEPVEGNGGRGRKRPFNEEYLDMMGHYSMEPRTIGVGKSEQNGDVESANNVLKTRLNQYLLLRGSREFETVSAWETWAQTVCRKANSGRKRVTEELLAMRVLRVDRFAEFDELRTRVTSESMLVVKRNTYSVPARLVGAQVRVRLYEMELEVWHAGRRVLVVPRILGQNNYRVDYRHVVGPMLRKPGAFARYRYKEALFPGPVWQEALSTLKKALGDRKGEVAYLRILHLAAGTMECDVEAALVLLMGTGVIPEPELVKGLVGAAKPTQAPAIQPLNADPAEYDFLLAETLAEAG